MTIKLTDTNAFEHFKPLAQNIEDQMVRAIEAAFDRWFTARDGQGYRHYRYNDNSREAQDWRMITSFVSFPGGSGRTGCEVVLNEERLAKKAKELGEDSVLSMVAKIVAKVGDIEFTQLKFRGGANFTIHGFTNGHDVTIEQQTVFKISKHWTHYCQFPARIYVDGKFTPAKEFAEATQKVAA